jgi:Tol biopolymer transport system component
MKAQVRMLVVVIALIATVAVLTGCGSGSGGTVFLNVFGRSSWQPTAGGKLCLASMGGNGLLYLYTIGADGSSQILITPSFNQNPPVNVLEGGSQPAFSPNGLNIAFVSRRGGLLNASQTLYMIPTLTGDRSTLTTPLVPITNDSNTTEGSDAQPNWSPDGLTIIYSSTRVNGVGSLRTVVPTTAPVAPSNLLVDGNDNQFPCYNPQDVNQFVFQSNAGLTGAPDSLTGLPRTGIFISTGGVIQRILPAPAETTDRFTYGAPSWSPDGTKIAFHTDRAGDYDLWVYTVAGGALTHITSDSRSDGFPVWNIDGSALAFTRDRELWTCNADGTNQQRLSQRFQS